jgi:uncharacterized membrane protein
MMENLIPETAPAAATFKRSIVKTISYRVIVVILDSVAIYLFTGKISVALGFTIVSNIYTTIVYFLHERIWGKIKWGKKT